MHIFHLPLKRCTAEKQAATWTTRGAQQCLVACRNSSRALPWWRVQITCTSSSRPCWVKDPRVGRQMPLGIQANMQIHGRHRHSRRGETCTVNGRSRVHGTWLHLSQHARNDRDAVRRWVHRAALKVGSQIWTWQHQHGRGLRNPKVH